MSADIKWYLSGADTAGAAQHDPAASLGGARAANLAECLTFHRVMALAGIIIEYAAGANGPGNGTLEAMSANTLRWTPPGDDPGDVVTIANGETKAIYGDDTSKYLIVRRATASNLGGSETVQLFDEYGNAFGGSVFSEAESTAGANHYRAVFARNEGAATVTSLLVWIDDDYDTSVALAEESPTAGVIQDVADETTVPTGLSWVSPVSEATALEIGPLAADADVGLWIRRSVAAGASADARVRTVLRYKAVIGGVSYYGAHRGLSAVAEAGLEGYCFRFAEDADVADGATVDETAEALPYETTYAGTAGHTYYVRTTLRNAYGLESPVSESSQIIIDDSGNADIPVPAAPGMFSATPASNGRVAITATYYPRAEAPDIEDMEDRRATEWAVWVTDDGTTPDPDTDEPDYTEEMNARASLQTLRLTTTVESLEGAPITVLVCTRRDDGVDDGDEETPYVPCYRYSANRTPVTATAAWFGPTRPRGAVTQGLAVGHRHGLQSFAEQIEYIDEAKNIYWQAIRGETRLWADDVLVWNIKYDSGALQNSGWYTTFKMLTGHTPAVTSGTVEVGSWTEAEKLISLCANGQSWIEIDVVAKTITRAGAMTTTAPQQSRANQSIWPHYAATCLQVWDASTQDWATPISLQNDGELRRAVALRQKTTQAECL